MLKKALFPFFCALFFLVFPQKLFSQDNSVKLAETCQLEYEYETENFPPVHIGDAFSIQLKVNYAQGCTLNVLPSQMTSAVLCDKPRKIRNVKNMGFTEIYQINCKLKRPGYHIIRPVSLFLSNGYTSPVEEQILLKSLWIDAPLASYQQDEQAWLSLQPESWLVSFRTLETSIVFFVILFYACFFYIFFQRKSAQKGSYNYAYALLPVEIYIRDCLEKLVHTVCNTPEDHKSFYDELVYLLRWYITLRCDLENDECDTAQFQKILTKTVISEDLQKDIVKFMRFIDAIRFSTQSSNSIQNIESIHLACALLDRLDEEIVKIIHHTGKLFKLKKDKI